MPKSIASYLVTYSRNAFGHLSMLVGREETWKEAAAGLRRDTAKLLRHIGGKPAHSAERDEAVRVVKEGVAAFNEHRYRDAEDIFREAIELDGHYARAHTYLGHTLYKSGRIKEARAAWQRAIDVDPNSEAAAKARRKLQHVDRNSVNLRDLLDDHFRKD